MPTFILLLNLVIPSEAASNGLLRALPKLLTPRLFARLLSISGPRDCIVNCKLIRVLKRPIALVSRDEKVVAKPAATIARWPTAPTPPTDAETGATPPPPGLPADRY